MLYDPALIRAYDIRGKVGDELTPALLENFGKAFGTLVRNKDGGKTTFARDFRQASSFLARDFVRGVLSTGIHVCDLGVATTPMLYFSIISQNLDGGAIVTGSHNDPSYSGIKLCGKDAMPVFGEELLKLAKIACEEDFAVGEGFFSKHDIYPSYEADILSRVKLDRPLKIVIGDLGGFSTFFYADVLRRLGCAVLEVRLPQNAALDSDPTKVENYGRLSEAVRERSADLGVLFDADGDRLSLIDEKGQHVTTEALGALFAKDIFGKRKVKFVCDVKSLLGFKKVVEETGAKVEMLPTGRSYFRQRLYDDKEVALGIEASGHLYFNDNFLGYDDALFALSRLLVILSQARKTLSEAVSFFPKSVYTPVIEPYCPDDRKFAVVDKVRASLGKKYAMIDIDGVRVVFDDNTWALVRASNTGPRLTLRFEAPNVPRLKEIIAVAAEELKKYPEVAPWEDNVH